MNAEDRTWRDAAHHREVGRALGFDLHRYTNWNDASNWPPAVREGFAHAMALSGNRGEGDYAARKWVQLRLGAYLRDRPVSDDVTVDFVRAILVDTCPVLRVPLTRGELAPTDASIDRLNNDGAYAPGNLAVISAAANRAKGALDFSQVHARAQAGVPTEGLSPQQWLRLAGLMLGPCFAASPAAAPLIPLTVAIPDRTVRLAVEQVQHLFATRCGRPMGKNELIKRYRVLCRDERSGMRLRRLADAVHDKLKGLAFACDVWLFPPTMQALAEWKDSLSPATWNAVGDLSIRLLGGKEIGDAWLNAWRLGQRGYR